MKYFDGYELSVAFIDPSQNPNQLFTSESELNLGSIPKDKFIQRSFTIENFSDQAWKFNGYSAPDGLEVTFSQSVDAMVPGNLKLTVKLKKEEIGRFSDDIKIFWNDSMEFRMDIKAEVFEYEKAQNDQIYLSLRSGEIVTLDKDYNFIRSSNTGLFNIEHLTIDSSGFLFGASLSNVYQIDPNTGTVLQEFFDENKQFGYVFFGDATTYLWESHQCFESPKVWTGKDYELLYEFQNNGDEGACITSAIRKEGTQEFYYVSGYLYLYRIDLSEENPTPELLLEHNSLDNLHFTENGQLRATRSPYGDDRHEILQISADFSSVRVIAQSPFLPSLEIASLAALPLSSSVVLQSPSEDLKQDAQSRIYPNPFKDQLTLEGPSHLIKNAGLYSLSGQLIEQLNSSDQMDAIYHLEPNLQPGLYLLKISYENGDEETLKVLRNRE